MGWHITGTGVCGCLPLAYPQSVERDAEQSVSCLVIRDKVKHLLCSFLINVTTLCKGVGYKHLTFAEAGILASTAGLLLGQWVHIKEAIVPVGRRGRTGNSSCSASAKFYNSLEKCKNKAFYLCSQGGKSQFFQHCWAALRCGTPKLMNSRKQLHFLKTTLSTLG